MSRRRAAIKRQILPDPVYGSVTIARFINRLMKNGKKAVAEKVVYVALEKLEKEGNGTSAMDLFEQALGKLRPSVEVRSRRVGGATYQVPVEVRSERREALAMRWLIEAARGRSEKTMALRLAAELKEAVEGRGNGVKKREEVHKMAKANQAFAHFRW
jgi:small subunit ribosomal protein S7